MDFVLFNDLAEINAQIGGRESQVFVGGDGTKSLYLWLFSEKYISVEIGCLAETVLSK